MNKLNVGLTMLGVMMISGQALADIGEQGQLAVGAERLTGFSHSWQSTEDDTATRTTSFNNFSLLGMPLGGLGTAYSFPRVGVDYFPIDGLSIGGSLTYTHLGSSYKVDPDMGPTVESSGSLNVFLIAPRVGYAFMFTDSIGLWPRGGITYIRSSSSSDDNDSASVASQFAFSVEAPFLFAPARNVAFTVGPTIDLGLSYSGEDTDADGNTTKDDATNPAHEVGLQAGLTVFF